MSSLLHRLHSPSHASVLAGVDDILDRCKDFCLRNFIKHASRNAILGSESLVNNPSMIDITYFLVSALLVTGRPGAGKTSIVQAVAKSLQEDSRVHSCML